MRINQLKQIYKDGFDDSDAFVDFFFANLIKEENIITHSENEKLISAGYIVEKPAVMFGKETDLAYLSALSTLKEYRGQGKIRHIIEPALNTLFLRGHTFAMLHPFNYDYYKRYSFENVSYCSDGEIKGGTQYLTRKIKPDDTGIVLNIYSKMTQNFDNRLNFDTNAVKLKIAEFASDNIDGIILSDENNVDFAFAFIENGFLSFYACADFDKLIQAENLKGSKFYNYSENERPFLQGRIINAEKALLSYPYDKNLKVKLKIGIIDKEIKDNNINREISIENGTVLCEPVKNAETVFSIQKLTEIMFNGDNFLFKKPKNCFVDKY